MTNLETKLEHLARLRIVPQTGWVFRDEIANALKSATILNESDDFKRGALWLATNLGVDIRRADY